MAQQRHEESPVAYAHTLPNRPEGEWQPLAEHLRAVAVLAGERAAKFGGALWGELAGLWHDLGKYAREFQAYLRGGADVDYHHDEIEEHSGRVDHSSAGAQHAVSTLPAVLGHILAFVVSGHHSGLLDAQSSGAACLRERLAKVLPDWRLAPSEITRSDEGEELSTCLSETLKRLFGTRSMDKKYEGFALAFFVRMLFSCLVDADFLDTERFIDPDRAAQRPCWPADILNQMSDLLDEFVGQLANDSPVGRQRAYVREACLTAADLPPGFFSLTVPTGGGKTLASLAFALRHAVSHGLDRVIYVVPFTSIIEQNADVFREVFQPLTNRGVPDPVIEHHSAFDVGRETLHSRLATENWDAPLIVTTSVQFYESLFANRPARCRKLHNIARSVVILDEVQKIPVDFLEACLCALRELVECYGTTVVLCTATQPAIGKRPNFDVGLEDVREIVPDPPELYAALKRVEVRNLGDLTDAELADRFAAHDQVLCIVNTRYQARVLFEALEDRGVQALYHLSAAMCPEHRSAVLAQIRDSLGAGKPCRVVATQVVEAGVDVDFPIVYRALAGLDSIAQAAGRCNRNGRLATGITFVFRSEHRTKERFLSDTIEAGLQIVGSSTSPPLYDDLLSLEAVEHYFRLYFWTQKERWDREGILRLFRFGSAGGEGLPLLFNFASVAERFRLIRDTGEPVVIPWGKQGAALVSRLRFFGGDRLILRALQRYVVQVPRRSFRRALDRGAIELVHDRFPVLVSPEFDYDDRLGLILDREATEHSAAEFVL